MGTLTLSIIKNKVLLEIIKELKLFSKFKIKLYDNFKLCLNESSKNKHLIVLFNDTLIQDDYVEIIKKEIPIIIVTNLQNKFHTFSYKFLEKINTPFRILDFEKKITSLLARYEFNKTSVINLSDYIIDKNERKIKRNNLELQLTEKEVNFLILFSHNNKPINKSLVLKQVWNYSSESDTHTVETHIHRLRKKILEKFGDNNFIKNNNEGYYI